MAEEELGILMRIARALFPEEPVYREDPFEIQVAPQFPADAWRQYDGIWIASTPSMADTMLGGGYQAARLPVHVPGLYADERVLRAAAAGVMPKDSTTRDLIADPGVNEAMGGHPVLLREEMVAMRKGEASIERLQALARAVDAARRAPWQAVAKKLGLPLDDRALSIVGNTGGLLGNRESFDVRIREERRHTRIRIALPPGLPEGFRVVAGKPKPDEQIGHPILDRALTFRGVDRLLRRKLLAIEEPLLNLLGDRPQSDLDPRRIRVVVEGRMLSELDGLVEDALAVVRALRP
ncbi:MAG: hypothetical protein EP330_21525 [Deltaproteobacteria bacterium]|nr:MAG: hypothetical protein EP330_21525 [Deltaproteobacteria bacterium]